MHHRRSLQSLLLIVALVGSFFAGSTAHAAVGTASSPAITTGGGSSYDYASRITHNGSYPYWSWNTSKLVGHFHGKLQHYNDDDGEWHSTRYVTVWLLVSPDGGDNWTRLTHARTDSGGRVSFKYDLSCGLSWRVDYSGNGTYGPAHRTSHTFNC